MAPVYSYSVHDLATNVRIAELPLRGVDFSKILNGSGQLSASFTVPPRATSSIDVYDVTTPCRRCIYVWRDEVPVWGGVIWTRRYSSRTRQIQLGAADWWSLFDHRKVLPVLTAPIDVQFEVAEQVVSYAAVEQNTIARNLVALAQSHTGGDLLIEAETASTSLINRDRTYRGYELVEVGEALRQLANTLNGPDMVFDVDPVLGADGLPVRRFRQGSPRMGQEGAPWVWEFGANLVDYEWESNGAGFASRVLTSGEGTVEGTPIAVAEDTSIYAAGYPLLETETAYTTVSVPATLQEHADSDQQAARLPGLLLKLDVRGDHSPIVGEWGLGDDGRVVIDDDFHRNGFDGLCRIIGTTIRPPDDGDEQVTLTTSPLFDETQLTA